MSYTNEEFAELVRRTKGWANAEVTIWQEGAGWNLVALNGSPQSFTKRFTFTGLESEAHCQDTLMGALWFESMRLIHQAPVEMPADTPLDASVGVIITVGNAGKLRGLRPTIWLVSDNGPWAGAEPTLEVGRN